MGGKSPPDRILQVNALAALTDHDLQIHRIRVEVDRDRQHGHGGERDAAGEQEEEDQAADQETQRHGDEHIQLPGVTHTPTVKTPVPVGPTLICLCRTFVLV